MPQAALRSVTVGGHRWLLSVWLQMLIGLCGAEVISPQLWEHPRTPWLDLLSGSVAEYAYGVLPYHAMAQAIAPKHLL